MKTIDNIISTYNSLNDLFQITNGVIVSLKDDRLKPHRILLKHLEELKGLNILEEHDKNITWKADAPTIEMTYNFYSTITKESKNFENIKDVIENPEKYSNDELREAIALNGIYLTETGKSLVDTPEENIVTIKNNDLLELDKDSTKELKLISINSVEYVELNKKYVNLSKEHQELEANYRLLMEENKLWKNQSPESGGMKELISLIEGFAKDLIINTNRVALNSDKFDSLSGSFRKVIGMLTTIQMNEMQQTKAIYSLMIDRQIDLNGVYTHEGSTNRKENIENTLAILKELIKYNDTITNQYMNGKK